MSNKSDSKNPVVTFEALPVEVMYRGKIAASDSYDPSKMKSDHMRGIDPEEEEAEKKAKEIKYGTIGVQLPPFPKTEGDENSYEREEVESENKAAIETSRRLDRMKKTGNLAKGTPDGFTVGSTMVEGRPRGQC